MLPRTLLISPRGGALLLGAFAAGALLFGASAVHGEGGSTVESADYIKTHATYQFTSDAEVDAEVGNATHTDIRPGSCGCFTAEDRVGAGLTVAADGDLSIDDGAGIAATASSSADAAVESESTVAVAPEPDSAVDDAPAADAHAGVDLVLGIDVDDMVEIVGSGRLAISVD